MSCNIYTLTPPVAGCIRASGKDYRGNAASSESGQPCLHWSDPQIRDLTTQLMLDTSVIGVSLSGALGRVGESLSLPPCPPDVRSEQQRPSLNPFVWPDLEGQRLTKIGQLAHHWIRNVPSYPLVCREAQSHSGARWRGWGGGGTPPPP